MNGTFDETLQAIIKQASPDVQERISQDIEYIVQADIHSFEALTNAVCDKTKSVDARRTACWLLGQLRKKRAAPALLWAFSEDDPIVYWEAAKALGTIGSKKTLKPLTAILRSDTSEDRRAASVHALGLLADERSIDVLLEVLNNPSETPRVRGEAAEALSILERADRIVETLVKCLQDPSIEVQFWAAFALGHQGDPQAIPALERLTSTSQDMLPEWGKVSQEARDAITAIRERKE